MPAVDRIQQSPSAGLGMNDEMTVVRTLARERDSSARSEAGCRGAVGCRAGQAPGTHRCRGPTPKSRFLIASDSGLRDAPRPSPTQPRDFFSGTWPAVGRVDSSVWRAGFVVLFRYRTQV